MRTKGVCAYCGHVEDNHSYGEIEGEETGNCLEQNCDCDVYEPNPIQRK